MPTSSTHTLLWDRGWCTKSLIHALGIQHGTCDGGYPSISGTYRLGWESGDQTQLTHRVRECARR